MKNLFVSRHFPKKKMKIKKTGIPIFPSAHQKKQSGDRQDPPVNNSYKNVD